MRTNLYIKVVVEHDEKESPEKLGSELCRQLLRAVPAVAPGLPHTRRRAADEPLRPGHATD